MFSFYIYIILHTILRKEKETRELVVVVVVVEIIYKYELFTNQRNCRLLKVVFSSCFIKEWRRSMEVTNNDLISKI